MWLLEDAHSPRPPLRPPALLGPLRWVAWLGASARHGARTHHTRTSGPLPRSCWPGRLAPPSPSSSLFTPLLSCRPRLMFR